MAEDPKKLWRRLSRVPTVLPGMNYVVNIQNSNIGVCDYILNITLSIMANALVRAKNTVLNRGQL